MKQEMNKIGANILEKSFGKIKDFNIFKNHAHCLEVVKTLGSDYGINIQYYKSQTLDGWTAVGEIHSEFKFFEKYEDAVCFALSQINE